MKTLTQHGTLSLARPAENTAPDGNGTGTAGLSNKPTQKCTMFAGFVLVGIHLLGSGAWGGEPSAEELLSYATALTTKGQVVKMGSEGIVLNGESIEGVATRRPSDAVARAAELIMEQSISSKNPVGMKKAIALWKQIDQTNCAIPYLRMVAKGTDSFSVYCLASVATIYAESGDMESAKNIFDRLDGRNIRDEFDAWATACSARFSLSIGEYDRAGTLARLVMDHSDPNKFSGAGGDASFSIARSVLKVVPGASQAEEASAVPVRGDALERARTALSVKDYESAITAFIEHRRLMPNEPSAREALLQAAALAEKLKQTDRALGLYREAEVQYSAYPEGWKAALAAANLLESQGNLQGALKSAGESLAKCKIPEASAWLTLRVAELSAQTKDTDRAADLYAELLSKYAAQDAARDAFKRLEAVASQIKDWKRLARQLQELAATNTNHLTNRDLSRLRRLVLGLYVGNDKTKEAQSWLKSLPTSQEDAEWLDKDQAWLSASIAQQATERLSALSPRDLVSGIDAGIEAAKLAPRSEEALAGLRAATTLATIPNSSKRANRELESSLRAMLECEYKEEARSLLVRYYEFLGDARAIQALK
jgi:tetratricopeptide (TPR) repeat protein